MIKLRAQTSWRDVFTSLAIAIAAAASTILGALTLDDVLRGRVRATALTRLPLPVEPSKQETAVETDDWKFVLKRVQMRTSDGSGRVNGAIYASLLGQSFRTVNGLHFPDQPKILAQNLLLSLSPDGGSYRPIEFLEGLLQTILNSSASPERGVSRSTNLFGLARRSKDSEIDRDREMSFANLIGNHGNRPALWELDAQDAQIEFLTEGDGKLLVSAGSLNATSHNGGLVFLANEVLFHRGDEVDLQAFDAVWSIDTNTFYIHQGQEMTRRTNRDAPEFRDVLTIGCMPSPDYEWRCFCSASYPALAPDPLATVAFRVRAEFSRQLGLCDTFVGPLVCQ